METKKDLMIAQGWPGIQAMGYAVMRQLKQELCLDKVKSFFLILYLLIPVHTTRVG